MNLRKLQLKDARLMLEWMQNRAVVEDLQADFGNKTIADCNAFITKSWSDRENFHLAIVDDTDTYMGTVSLKNIQKDRKQAEFAIAVRLCAMGTGISKYAMEEIIRKGFEELDLERIYWYVSSNNKRALRFYEKNGYRRMNMSDIAFVLGGVRHLCICVRLVSGGKISQNNFSFGSLLEKYS